MRAGRNGRSVRPAALAVRLDVRRSVCANGLVLLLLPKHDLPLVSAEIWMPAGITSESESKAGVAELTGRMLAEGTRKRSALEIAQAIESVGGEFSTTPTGGVLEVRSRDLALGLDLLRECLFEPAFPPRQLEKAREKQLASILADRDNPQRVARAAFDEAVYGRHPYHRPGKGYARTVKRLARADCLAHHRAHFTPRAAILAVAGDFDPGEVARRVERGWGALDGPPPPPARDWPVARQKRRQVLRVKLDKRQCHIYLGHLGVRRTHPDYYRLEVLDHVLGLGAGFTDRLSATLRDQMGLAYTVYATITATAQTEPGTFHAYIGTAPENERAAVDGIVKEIKKIREREVSPEELAGAKAYLTGSFVFRFETVQQLAHHLLRAERYGLADYHERYPAWIEAVTAREVKDAARKHLDPERYTLVVGGPA